MSNEGEGGEEAYQDNVLGIIRLRWQVGAIREARNHESSCGFTEHNTRKIVTLGRGEEITIVLVGSVELRPRREISACFSIEVSLRGPHTTCGLIGFGRVRPLTLEIRRECVA